MLGPSFCRAHAIRRPRLCLCHLAALLLASTHALCRSSRRLKIPGLPTPATKVGTQRPRPKSSSLSPTNPPSRRRLMQLNNALEGLAAKVSPP